MLEETLNFYSHIEERVQAGANKEFLKRALAPLLGRPFSFRLSALPRQIRRKRHKKKYLGLCYRRVQVSLMRLRGDKVRQY